MDYLINLDSRLLLALHDLTQNSFFDHVLPIITKIGNMGFVWVVTGVILLCTKAYRHVGLYLLATLLIGYLVFEIGLKNLVQRPRPFTHLPVDLLIPPIHSYSFPSGHAMSSFASATILSHFFRRYSWLFFLAASIMAFSRVYLLVHFPFDVVMGSIFGVLTAVLMLHIKKTINARTGKP